MTVIRAGGKRRVINDHKEEYPGASQKILPAVSPTYGVNPSISCCCTGDVITEKKGTGE
jgi:hypothetical protein